MIEAHHEIVGDIEEEADGGEDQHAGGRALVDLTHCLRIILDVADDQARRDFIGFVEGIHDVAQHWYPSYQKVQQCCCHYGDGEFQRVQLEYGHVNGGEDGEGRYEVADAGDEESD